MIKKNKKKFEARKQNILTAKCYEITSLTLCGIVEKKKQKKKKNQTETEKICVVCSLSNTFFDVILTTLIGFGFHRVESSLTGIFVLQIQLFFSIYFDCP